MPSPTPGPTLFRRAWLQWKALRLPWRKKWLVGSDLAGNTYWEFKSALHANRVRRIVEYPSDTHFGDVHITPLWHQWLRHLRQDAPSISEQQLDEVRQIQIKKLAAQADARWEAQQSFLVAPEGQGDSHVPDIRSRRTAVPTQTFVHPESSSGAPGAPPSRPRNQAPQTKTRGVDEPAGWTPTTAGR